jgi:AraC-like DNA-binding protein
MLIKLLEILIFGSLVLLGIMLIFNPLNVNRKANIWFGFFLFIWASFWLDEIVHTVGADASELGSLLLLNFIRFLSPVVFYFSIRYFTNPDFRIGRDWILYLVIPAAYLSLLILDNLLEVDFKIVLIALLFFHGLLYLYLSLALIKNHKKHIEQFASDTLEIDLSWLASIVWVSLFLVFGVMIFNVLFYEAPLNLFMNGFVYLIVLFTAYHSLKQKEIFPADYHERAEALSVVKESGTTVIENKLVQDDKLVEAKAQLYDLIAKEELYLDSELNLGKLAKKLDLSSHQLSYVINNGFNQNFYGFINKYRVEKAKKLLADKELDKFSIIGIAFESGFNSKTSFNTTFKKITGKTPSEFKKSCSGL